MIKIYGVVSIVAVVLFCGCAQIDPKDTAAKATSVNNEATDARLDIQACEPAWFEKVAQQIITGDGQGHGPDLGSLEWRSVVEFRLGIRGDNDLPELDSDLWCDYIDTHYLK
ncbi:MULTISPECIES: hypothetical protein [unclassified Shewanella]|uniref:hypothetical protein n=1 Tax=unclassified Shewanella TaxID=196818 RepID=UPI001BB8FB87|nr:MULTISPECIES: hypothetical protein [unclassified Shewanella]GIU13337.1 hypothetical protein TUM4444_21760 [Shewanella sp. MBTL60-112-B1]GIU27344.1 hypothetical protein TUM4445_07410 [Shewanella sp. MBTL60-112-B2]